MTDQSLEQRRRDAQQKYVAGDDDAIPAIALELADELLKAQRGGGGMSLTVAELRVLEERNLAAHTLTGYRAVERVLVHRFDSTSEAYDASQCYDEIHGGDVLVVESERVVGVLVGAWPVAITAERGSFHRLADGADEPDHFRIGLAWASAIVGELGLELEVR